MPLKTPLLSISDLHVEFDTDEGIRKILHGVNLTIKHGESFALIGGSGSGKSVTAQAIMQLLPRASRITKGDISFCDEKIQNKTEKEMQQIRGKKIGMIFQNPMTSLNPTISIGKQIGETLRFHDRLTSKQAYQRTLELLHLVGIADPKLRYNAYPFQLSGGMCQRVMIAMTLAAQPQLLIADEPTTALDVTVQAQILNLLKKIIKELGMTLFLITHDLGVVAGTCDHVAVMEEGVIVETATVEMLFKSPQHPYTKTLFASHSREFLS